MSEAAHPVLVTWLAAYYDGELEAARREELEAHLLICADCQRELAALKSLSEMLSTDDLASHTLTDKATFWRALEPRLPDRRSASSTIADRSVLFRWLPGISLLVLNGAIQAVAVMGTALMFILSHVAHVPAWTYGLNRLATGATLGWLAWLWPAEWSGLGLFAMSFWVGAGLAVSYLAWLAYEWRYGAVAARRAAA